MIKNKNKTSPAGIKENIDECSGNGRQCIGIQGHDTKLVLWDQNRVNCRLNGCKNKHSVSRKNGKDWNYYKWALHTGFSDFSRE